MGHSGKQNSTRCDAAERGVPSGAIFCLLNGISSKNEIKIKKKTPKNESGLTQMIMMGKSIRQIWLNIYFSIFCV